MEQVLAALFSNLDPGIVAIVILFSRLIGKVIPDEKSGFLGVVRHVAKVLGLYAKNRETEYD